jgi:hypothetical protein
MSARREVERIVRSRAGERCEYCRMHQSLQGATFHLEHVIPRSRHGTSELDNLAWACPGCNLHKADRLVGADPDTSESVPLFHPRLDQWTDHFRWRDFEIVGLTSTGRATVGALYLTTIAVSSSGRSNLPLDSFRLMRP